MDKELNVRQDFKTFINPLQENERRKLEQSILDEGIRDPIITWNGTIIDGHNRYDISKQYNISFNTLPMDFETETEVKIWIANNQLGRRNLVDADRAMLALTLEGLYAEQAKDNQSAAGGDKALLSKSTKAVNPIHARKQAAEDAGLKETKYHEAKTVLKSEHDDIIDQYKANKISTHKAYTMTKSRDKDAGGASTCKEVGTVFGELTVIGEAEPYIQPSGCKKRVVKCKCACGNIFDYKLENLKRKGGKKSCGRCDNDITNKTYDAIYVDPNWGKITLERIKTLSPPSKDDSVLYFWADPKDLVGTIELIQEWGFTVVESRVWTNDKALIDWNETEAIFTTRKCHDLMLIGKKGAPKIMEDIYHMSSVTKDKGPRRHPGSFLTDVWLSQEGGSFLELLSRSPYNDDWDVMYGNLRLG